MSRRENGEGCISKKPRKDGRYQGYVDVGINPKTGKKKRKYLYGKTPKEVKEKRNEINGQIYSGTYCDPGKTTFGEWLDNWLHLYKGNDIKQTTWERYESIIKNHLKPCLGQKKLGALQTSDLQRVCNKKLDKGLSVRTVRYINQTAKYALGQAYDEKKINRNPALAVKLPSLQRGKMQTYSKDQLSKFFYLAHKETRWYFYAFLVIALTGLRRGELLALRWKNIDFEKKTLTVQKTLVRTKNGLILDAPKTNAAIRTLELPVFAWQAICKQRRFQEKFFKEKGWQLHKNVPVFFTRNGGEIDPNFFSREFKKLARKLVMEGFPEISLHGLRHTYATLSSEMGINIQAISENLGHHSPEFTMKVYAHVTPKMRTEATKKINSVMASQLQLEKDKMQKGEGDSSYF